MLTTTYKICHRPHSHSISHRCPPRPLGRVPAGPTQNRSNCQVLKLCRPSCSFLGLRSRQCPLICSVLGNLKDWLPGGSNSKNDEGKKQKLETIIEEDEEEVGGEEEGNTMVRIDTESRTGVAGDDVFGPLAVLMIGFLEEDVAAFRKLMVEMEADMVKLIPCTKAMLSGTLQQALEAEVPPYQQPPLGTRRALVLSGMYGSEVVEVVTAYKESGLPPAVFAAAVPRNYSRVVKELLSEVYADHMAMQQRVAQQRLAAEAADNSDDS